MDDVVKVFILNGESRIDKITLSKNEIKSINWSILKEDYDKIKKMRLVAVSPRAKEFMDKHF
jgi:hypothetical protein